MANNPIFHSRYTAQQIEGLIEHGSPIIVDGHWHRWDVAAMQYVDTGITADSEVAAQAAEAAQAAAEYAQGKAEDAQTAAETAQGLAEGARDAAAASAASIAASAAQIDANTKRINYVALREEEDRQILFGSIVEAAEDTYAELRSAPIHNAITIGSSVYPRMDRTRMAIDRLLGRTVAFNQLADAADTHTTHDVVCTKNADGTITLNGTTDASGALNTHRMISAVAGHKYLIFASSNAYATGRGIYCEIGGSIGLLADAIRTASVTGNATLTLRADASVAFNTETILINCIDLTAMYGTTLADSIYALEQATTGAGVAYVRQRLDLDYYAANSGELVAPVVSGVGFVGFNLWDEEWELGYYSTTDGSPVSGSSTIRSKNFIPVISGESYCFGAGVMALSSASDYILVLFYDAEKNFVKYERIYSNWSLSSFIKAVPDNCHYVRFFISSGYGTTYNHDICINLSSSRNGEYQPYQHTSLSLPSTRLDGVGTAQDVMYVREDGENDYSLIKTAKMALVDLGTLTWTRSTSYAHPFFYTNEVVHYSEAGISCVCDSYVALANTSATWFGNEAPDKSVAMQIVSNNQVYVRDDSYSDAASFKTAMSGKYLCYVKATPTETVIASHLTLADISAIAENGGIISIVNENGHIVQPDLTCDVVISRSAS